ncbi:penicillin acylase family protein [Pararobbsia silviterrae]|uniref:penicillin acylase family protein n=1 Tax=Pararobbsia silviterrae TaxID=1792498 RepID=UPI0013147F1F|nr:penicillin acylase family protein [Pararobbsia silviterrae]
MVPRTGRLRSKRFWLRLGASLAGAALVVAGGVLAGAWAMLDASLPRLDGVVSIGADEPAAQAGRADPAQGRDETAPPGLASAASIVRDAAGHVTIEAASRTDAAFATGYAHAQDRFFQMDLLRRIAAGELAALFGPQAVRVDEQNRLHRFRARAVEAVRALPADERAVLDAYTAGVNTGLASLKVRPFEYLVLHASAEPWRDEDSMLVLYAMYLDLQSGEMRRIASRGVLAQQMSPALAAFLLQRGSHWDAPLDRAVPAVVYAGGSDGSNADADTHALPPRAAADGSTPDAANASAAPVPGPAPVPIPAERPAWLDDASDPHSIVGADARGAALAAWMPSLDLPALASPALELDPDARSAIGSNSFAVDGARTVGGAAGMVANDMHLGLNLPNIWYRLVIEVAASSGRAAMRVAGVSLPGAPIVVVGSNGHVAWGFTNSYGHYVDLVEVQADAADPARYRLPVADTDAADPDSTQTPRRPLARRGVESGATSMQAAASRAEADGGHAVGTDHDAHAASPSDAPGWQHATVHRETIEVRGAPAVTLMVYDTPWGPEWRVAGHVYAVRWVAHDPQAANLRLMDMEHAVDVHAAMDVAQHAGIPTQNIVIADRAGHIGWTLAGPLPHRGAQADADAGAGANFDASSDAGAKADAGTDGMPVPAGRYTRWDGYLDAASYPVRIDPHVGALWTANNRQLDSADQAKIGDGGADVGARATQIRDDLAAHARFDERGLLAIALDDRAKALAFWRAVMLDALDPQALDGHPDRATMRALVSEWDARADADSVGYTLVRDFESAMYDGWFGALDAHMSGRYAGSGYRGASSHTLAIMETLAREHAWVPHRFENWRAFVLNRVDAAIARDTADGALLDQARWGERNRAAIAHPFARMLPAAIAAHLGAPPDRLPGDINMPRVQGRSFGASERMVVSPGHEDQGILEMPGGASGHPLSPFFLAGHEDWVQGRPSAFLPGPAAHRLVLRPGTSAS